MTKIEGVVMAGGEQRCRHGNKPPCKKCIKEYQEENYDQETI